MMPDLRDRHVAGVKQLQKAIQAGRVERAYIARDADPRLTKPVADLCQTHGVPVEAAESMKALGDACGIDVKTAAAGLLRSE